MTKRWPSLITAFFLSLTVTGNAVADGGSWFDDKMSCIVIGALSGAAVGAAVDGITVGGGTVGGAIIGALFCQPADADGDGVPDYRDKCPGTPKGAKVDADGCEPKAAATVPATAAAKIDGDSDGDGVPDSKDKCPDTPKGAKVDHNGCTLVEKLVLKGVWFAFDSAKITPDSAKVLDEVALIFKRYPSLEAEMGGHTCSVGTEKYNQKLSERRAEAVRQYLIGQGVDAKRLTAKGYGELQPAESNASREGREKNRRTEMHIIKQ